MKAGVKDIIDHRFYRDFDWRGLLYMNLDPPYTPKIKYCDNLTFNKLKVKFLIIFYKYTIFIFLEMITILQIFQTILIQILLFLL